MKEFGITAHRRPRSAAVAAVLVLLTTGWAEAVEIMRFGGGLDATGQPTALSGDDQFNALCNFGTSDLDCEIAVAELRGGDGMDVGGREWEAGLRNDILGSPFSPGVGLQLDMIGGATPDGDLRRFAAAFSLTHDGAEQLTLVYGPWDGAFVDGEAGFLASTSDSRAPIGRSMADMRTMLIRTRSNQLDTRRYGRTWLSDLQLREGTTGPATAIGENRPEPIAGALDTRYIQISDFDFGAAWRLTGVAHYEWDVALSFPTASRLDHTIKLTSFETPPRYDVPLPAAGWLLFSGAAALVALRRAK